MPEGYEYIWHWFIELAIACERITFTELKAWQDLKGWRLTGYEMDAIMALERTRRQS